MTSNNLDLFTRCSGCKTVFRVTTNDLQASGGQVRCGRCQTVFDAFASLTARPPSQVQEEATANSEEPVGGENAADDASMARSDQSAQGDPISIEPGALDLATQDPVLPGVDSDETVTDDADSSDDVPIDNYLSEPDSGGAVENDDVTKEPAAHMSTPERAFKPDSAVDSEHLEEIVEPQKPVSEPSGDAEHFVKDFQTNLYEWEFKPAPSLLRPRLWMSFTVLLAIIAVAQVAYAFRTQIMVNFPQSRVAYVQVCAWLSCEIGLPRLADQLDISASDLQVINPDVRNQVELTALVRNRARVSVEYPAFELTLTNEGERVVARRVFLPEEYLPDPGVIGEGLAGSAELAVRLFLDVGSLGAAGYRIYLFYPSG